MPDQQKRKITHRSSTAMHRKHRTRVCGHVQIGFSLAHSVVIHQPLDHIQERVTSAPSRIPRHTDEIGKTMHPIDAMPGAAIPMIVRGLVASSASFICSKCAESTKIQIGEFPGEASISAVLRLKLLNLLLAFLPVHSVFLGESEPLNKHCAGQRRSPCPAAVSPVRCRE